MSHLALGKIYDTTKAIWLGTLILSFGFKLLFPPLAAWKPMASQVSLNIVNLAILASTLGVIIALVAYKTRPQTTTTQA